ncbi:phosphoenolpyruvate--protein phosphotransferase [Dermatophilus congolensis]|uniref:phosphoenolpyruvate--protein phosphotransferase n=1 Tax=Dermatophilus congolensis TaxID=1863 RepID=UPI001AB05028|nr:phosphoenolpyruvate--protein phosphotransferase [Dermatophilus congolensis]MBO3147194.1 phosphoenolpyruvate--protein phosphotransferase [Dermatophilus congolensis]
MTETHRILTGIGVSAGTASGPVVTVRPAPGFDADEPPTTDVVEATRAVREALEATAAGLEARVAHATESARPVLEATAMMARDPGLAAGIEGKLATGSGLTRAVHDAVADYIAMFESLGGYMAERTSDLRDVRDRVICRLRGLNEPGIPELVRPCVLVAADLAPAETATLTPGTVLGIVTSEGGPTSHTAILAAQLGIPAVVQAKGVLDVSDGTEIALDGGVGEVIISPTLEEQTQLAERATRRARALEGSRGPGATMDDHKVALLANIGTIEDARSAAEQDLEGSGLFRTEFLFLERDCAPTLEEQTATYTDVFTAFGDRRVVVRTLDAGADKPLAFADLGEEENPALGRRGLRLSMARVDLLETQLQALAAAHRATGADVHVMAPMVATVDEAEWFAERARAHGLPSVGIMVEIPAAALRARHMFEVVDFVSIGTNDLSQYTLAADRMQGELSGLLDPWQPALLELVARTCEAGLANGKKTGVCGEAGGDPLMALVLIGLGVTSLSMAPGRVKAVRAALRMHQLHECRHMAESALQARSAADARQAVLELVSPSLHDLL